MTNINNNYEHLFVPLHVNEDYYDEASLNETIAENNNSSSCIHVNIRSCRKNLDELLFLCRPDKYNFFNYSVIRDLDG